MAAGAPVVAPASGTRALANRRSTAQGSDLSLILSTEIPASMLRAVSLQTVLAGCGASFRSNSFDQANYAKSAETTYIDDFISHDWGSEWAGKAAILCMLYNGWPAAVISLTAGVIIAVLQCSRTGPVLPAPKPSGDDGTRSESYYYGYWCQAICPIIYLFVLLFWQDIRARLRLPCGSRRVFLDKFCIDQEDAALRDAGILGLGGFLRHTRRLVICWTPRYFTRLWCTYEVATWLHLGKPLSSVVFLPVSHAKMLFAIGLVSWSAAALFAVGSLLFPQYYLAIFVLAVGLMLPLGTHFLRRHVHDLRLLPLQLGEFSVMRAACFCCSVGHVLPGSDPAVNLACDREMVYETLRVWFPVEGRHADREGGMTAGFSNIELKTFDKEVRALFGPWMSKRGGTTHLPYKYILLTALPQAFRTCDVAAAFGQLSGRYLTKMMFFTYPTLVLCLLPVTFKGGFSLGCWLDRVFGIRESCIMDFLVTLLLSAGIILILAALWLPLNVVNDSVDSIAGVGGIAVLIWAVTLALYWEDVRAILPRGCLQESPAAKLPSSLASQGDGLTPALHLHDPLGDDDKEGDERLRHSSDAREPGGRCDDDAEGNFQNSDALGSDLSGTIFSC